MAEKRTRSTYEENPVSTAYVSAKEGSVYFGGGFNGGRASDFLLMAISYRMISGSLERSRYSTLAFWKEDFRKFRSPGTFDVVLSLGFIEKTTDDTTSQR